MLFINKITKSYKDTDIFQYRKAVALLIILLLGISFLFLYLLYGIIMYKKLNFPPTFFPTIVFLLISMLISYVFLITGKLNIAGNIFSTVPILTFIFISYWALDHSVSYLTVLLGTNLFLIIFLASGIIFSTKRVFLFNFIVIVLSIWIFYFVFSSALSYEDKDQFLRANVNYTFVFAALFLIINNSQSTFAKILSLLAKEKEVQEIKSKKLEDLVYSIQEGIKQLSEENQSLVELSSMLSTRVSEQAAATEEISSSTEEMSASLENTAEYVNQTYDSVEKADKELKSSTKNLKLVFDILDEVTDKMQAITDIAEKTDILAINAAIEAAHAGEYGAGFAVVAQEIRKLADSTKNFSKDVDLLVQKNAVLSEDLRRRFNLIIEEITLITQRVGSIKTTTEELLQTINVINSSTIQLTHSAEENASVAERLVGHTNNLNDLSDNLKRIL